MMVDLGLPWSSRRRMRGGRDGLNTDKIFTEEANTTNGEARSILGCRRSNELVGACIMILNGNIRMEEAMFLDGNNINFGGFGTMG